MTRVDWRGEPFPTLGRGRVTNRRLDMRLKENRGRAPSAPTWTIRSGKLNATVEAKDQFEAWDTWRSEDRYQFGLIAVALPGGDEDAAIPVKTSTLMERWGRLHDAEQFHALARSKGLEPARLREAPERSDPPDWLICERVHTHDDSCYRTATGSGRLREAPDGR